MIDNSSVVERFVGFLKPVGHKSEDMETALIQRFTDLDINFKRGQSYDNASICQSFTMDYRLVLNEYLNKRCVYRVQR